MTDKQKIIDELKNEIACKENIINHLAEHNIKLQVQFKEKEQECEYWKHQAELGLDTTDSLVKELAEKEQECEELTLKCVQLEESFKETADGLLKIQYALADHCNKYSKALAEIKPILEFYANSTIGEKQEDGSYKLEFTPSDIATPFCIKFDPKPAREALRKINEVEDEKNM